MEKSINTINIGVVRKTKQSKIVILHVDGYSGYPAKLIEFNSEDAQDEFKEFDVVAFDKKNFDKSLKQYKATKIQLVKNIKSELVKQFTDQLKFDYKTRQEYERNNLIIKKIEWDLLIGEIKELYDLYYEHNIENTRFYLDIESYLNSIDIENLLLKYDIEVKSIGRFIAGKDETANIYIESFGINEIYLNDVYLNRFLYVKEHIESLTDFASWQTIAREYINANKEIIDNIITKTKINKISEFRANYSRIDHRISLINQLNKTLNELKLKIDNEIKLYTKNKYYAEVVCNELKNY